MKRFFLSSLLLLFTVCLFGQESVNVIREPGIYSQDGKKLNEYKKTFEIKNNSDPDPLELAKIDISKYWKHCKDSTRVEVVDKLTGFTLILYSHKETRSFFNDQQLLITMPADQPRDQSKESSR